MAYRYLLVWLLLAANAPSPSAWAQHYSFPFRFEANQGQVDPAAKYLAHAAGFTAELSNTGIKLNLRHPIRMRFAGGNSNAGIAAQNDMPLLSNYYRGKNSHTGIKNYERVVYSNMYPGIDVLFRGNGRTLEFDFLLQPGSNPTSIALAFSGQEDMTIDDDGALLLRTEDGEVRMHAPSIYQETGGKRSSVPGRFVKRGKTVGVAVSDYDASEPLIIDPALTFSTYNAAGGNETPTGITVDRGGNIYVSYTTFDASDENEYQFVVSKISRDGSPGYITYIWELRTNSFANAIAVDAGGNAYVAGTADNTPPAPTTIPTVNAIQPNDAGGIDAFVAKLGPTGRIIFSTYLGGSGNDGASAIALDGVGGVWIAGSTSSTNFPTRNGYQGRNAGGASDGFLTKIDTAGTTILYSTYLGGEADDAIQRMAVDAAGNVFLAGVTHSTMFPGISDGLQGSNAFISKLNPAGTALLRTYTRSFVTWPGPSYSALPVGLINFALGSDGAIYIADAASLEKLDSGFNRVYSRTLNGQLGGLAVDAAGQVYLTGFVDQDDKPKPDEFPIVNSFRPRADNDAFVMKLPADGGFPVYSTLLSGTCTFCFPDEPRTTYEAGYVITVDSQDRAYVAAMTTASDFPTTGGPGWSGSSRVSQRDPVVFILDTNTPNSSTLATRLEEWFAPITYSGTWYSNASPNARHSGGSAKLALEPGARFSVAFTGAGEVQWFGCRDAWSGIAKVFLDGSLRATVDTYSATGACRQVLWSTPGVPAGPHTLTVEVTGTKNAASQGKWVWLDTIEITSAGDIKLGVAAPPEPGGTGGGTGGGSTYTRLEETASAVQLSAGWYSNSSSANSGRRAVLALTAGTRATFAFTGTAARWIGVQDNWSGIAKVYVDGAFKSQVDAYSATNKTQQVLFTIENLTAGNHTLVVEVTGGRNSLSAGSWVWVDAFEFRGSGTGETGGGTATTFTRVEQASAAAEKTGVWYNNTNTVHSGGSAILALDSGARATFTFTGTTVRWIGLKDGWSGIAKVYVDGVFKAEVDTYSSSQQSKVILFEIGSLPSGIHRITIEVTGRKNTAAASAWVWVDAFDYR